MKKIVGLKIEGELKQWRRKNSLFITGTLGDKQVQLRLKYPIVHYPEGLESPEHYVARTYYGDHYYLLNLNEEKL